MTKNLNDILSGLDEAASRLPTIARLLKRSKKGFKQKSANDVDRLTYLAVLSYVADEQSVSESLLEFLDLNTGEFVDGRRDLAVSLSMSRVMWSYFLRRRGEDNLSRELLGRPDIAASFNLDNMAPTDLDILVDGSPNYAKSRHTFGQSLLQDFLLDIDLRVISEESDEDSTQGDMLRACYDAFLEIVVVRERSFELNYMLVEKDLTMLDEDIIHYTRKLSYYLGG